MTLETKKIDSKIGIIAGNGYLPKQLVHSLLDKNIKPYMAALNDITEKDAVEGTEFIWSRIATVGKIIHFFKDNGVKQIVLIGGMKRPAFTSLIPDASGLKLLNKILHLEKAGDNSLLETVIEFMEHEDLEVLGIDEVMTELLADKGVIGKVEPNKKQLKDIEYGKHIAEEVGKLDIAQAVVVQHNNTLAVEGVDGTDALISRCASLQEKGHGAIMVKIKKPNQNRKIDLPAIGERTIERLHDAQMSGLAIQAGNTLMIDKEATIKKANELGIFIYGI